MRQEKSSLLRNKGFQSLLASLLCIVLGLLIGYIVLLIINPAGAGEAIRTIVENFLYYPSAAARLRYLGNTLVKTAPLLMCSLSVLFAYKVGLFNIGAAGQYVIGAGASLYCALGFGLPWYVCLLAAIAAGAVLGAISGLLKAYRNVNEVISCIMLNWISLYLVNALLSQVKETASPYTFTLSSTNPDAILPSLGLGALFSDNQYVTIAIPLTVIVAVGIWVLLEKTKLGYELRATGCNKFAAKYCGMKEKRNIILTMAIAGGLAGMGAATLFLTGFEQWQVTQSAVPAMGFNGIAAAFLGGLNPIGAIFSSYFIQHITNGGAYVDKTSEERHIEMGGSAMGRNILVVEDDRNICDLIHMYLVKEGFDVRIAGDGGKAIEEFQKQVPDLILLDIMLPVMDGWSVCAKIRETSKVPIIMLTAKGEVFDRIQGLEMGADDYVVKPFEMKELIARINAVLRRTEIPNDTSKRLTFDKLVIDLDSYELIVDGKKIDTPPKELELLYHLASTPNRVYTRNQLLDEVWGFDYFGDSRTVDVHIKRLREKIENVSSQWALKTVWGVGYKFELAGAPGAKES